MIDRAVNVTVAPGQIGLLLALIVMLTGKRLLTTMEMELLMAGFPIAQVSEEVRVQVIRSEFSGTYE